jgi:hypothetical protein
MIGWNIVCSEAVGVAAYGLIALALCGFFRARQGPLMGRVGWVTAGLLGLLCAMRAVAVFRREWAVSEDMALVQAAAQLVAGLSLLTLLRALWLGLARGLARRDRYSPGSSKLFNPGE